MNVAIACDQCGKPYEIDERLLGKRVKCAQCGAAFLAQVRHQHDAGDPLFASSPAHALPDHGASLGSQFPPSAPRGTGNVPNGPPVGGPTDQQFRLGAALLIPLVVLGMLLAIFAMKERTTGALVLIGLGPLFIAYGIAALVDPNIVRSAGKYGAHLPVRYKLIALVIGLAALGVGMPLVFLILWR